MELAVRTRLGAVLLAGHLILAPHTLGAAQDNPWENLRHVTRHRTYTIVDRQSNCVTGKISSVTTQSITLKRSEGGTVTIERSNVLRFGEGPQDSNVVYSGRSSWSDVKGIPKNAKEGVRVTTKDGKHLDGKLAGASDTDITLTRSGQTTKFTKGEVSQVYYLRYKPISDSAEYAAQEKFVFHPGLWPYFLNISAKIPVRLYDSSLPEDDAPIQCKKVL